MWMMIARLVAGFWTPIENWFSAIGFTMSETYRQMRRNPGLIGTALVFFATVLMLAYIIASLAA